MANPFPSNKIVDFKTNAESLDEYWESESEDLTTRLGKTRKTAVGHQAEVDNLIQQGQIDIAKAIRDAGYQKVGTFESGATLTDFNQALEWAVADGGDGNWYRWDGAYNKVVPASSTPAGTGGVGAGAWINITDLTLRSELPKLTALGGNAVFNQVSDLVSMTTKDGQLDEATLEAMRAAGTKFKVESFYGDGESGSFEHFLLNGADKSAQGYDGTEGFACFQIDLGSGPLDLWSCLVAKASVSIYMLGIIADGATINKLSPVAEFAESFNVDIVGSNSKDNLILFDDTFSLQHQKITSDTGIYLKYVGSLSDYTPIISLGAPINDYSPARFEVANPQSFLVGEALELSNGAFADILFIMGDYLYVAYIPDYDFDTESPQSFPSSGTVTGKTSGSVEAIISSRAAMYAPTNYNAGLKNVWLTTNLNLDIDGIPTSHVHACAVYANRLNGTLENPCIENVKTQGFWYSQIYTHCWTAKFGDTFANRCGYGQMFVDECNAISIGRLSATTCGTNYGTATRRDSAKIAFSYGVSLNIINMEVIIKQAPFDITAVRGLTVNTGDIESSAFSGTISVGGARSLEYMTNNDIYNANGKYSKGIKFNPIRFATSLGFGLRDFIDGCDLGNPCWDFTQPSNTWTSITNYLFINPASTNIKGLSFGKFSAVAYDFNEEFNKGFTLRDGVEFDSSMYKYLTFGYNGFAPSSITDLLQVDNTYNEQTISTELLDVTLCIDNGHAGTLTISVGDTTKLNTFTTTVPAVRGGNVFFTSFTHKYFRYTEFNTRLFNLDAVDKVISFRVNTRRLNS